MAAPQATDLRITIDQLSGFCFGVVRAIEMAEQELELQAPLLCLGDIVHNEEEVRRLTNLGLKTIHYPDLQTCAPHQRVLFRAHGEPPTIYQQAKKQALTIVDATCPVVVRLQRLVASRGQALKANGGQIIIYGKPDHAEVNGLLGQTDCERHVVLTTQDLLPLQFNRPTDCFSQTTMDPTQYQHIAEAIRSKMQEAYQGPDIPLQVHNTCCGQVSHRRRQIAQFAEAHDLILFVSGQKSSNGHMLFATCQRANPRAYLVSHDNDVKPEWLQHVHSVGICGATSTPRWLMENVARKVSTLYTSLLTSSTHDTP